MGMKGTAMTKGALADALATKCELKKSEASKILAAIAEIGTEEVKKAGVFSLPGLVRIKTRKKPATKAGKKEMFAKTVVKVKRELMRKLHQNYQLIICLFQIK